MGALMFIYLIRYNTLCLAGRELSRWARGDEKHDEARICGTLEKVGACYFAYIALYHPSVFSLLISCISEIVTDRRRSSGFSRGASIYRGVTRFVCGKICRHILLPCSTKVHIETTLVCSCRLHYRHHQHGRWQSRIGRVAGNKDLYLGTFSKKDLYLTVDL